MLDNEQDQIIYCLFPPPVPPSKFYVCYKKETCCAQGCCIISSSRISHLWYYWLIFLLIFGIISGTNWLCKRRASLQPRSRTALTIRCNRRRCCRNMERNTGCSITENGISFNNCNRHARHNVLLDRMLFTFGDGTPVGDPPSYSSIAPSESRFCPLFLHYGPPPAYSAIYQSHSRQETSGLPKNDSYDDAIVRIVNTNEAPSTSTATTSEINPSTSAGTSTDKEAKPFKEGSTEDTKSAQYN